MKRFKKRTLALVLASVVTVVGAFGAGNYQNSLMGLTFKQGANGAVDMTVQTKTLYSGNVTPVRKDENTFILMLPEVNSLAQTPDLRNVSTIESVNIRTMPYSSSAKGYTKITIKTFSPALVLSAKNQVYLPSSENRQEIYTDRPADEAQARHHEQLKEAKNRSEIASQRSRVVSSTQVKSNVQQSGVNNNPEKIQEQMQQVSPNDAPASSGLVVTPPPSKQVDKNKQQASMAENSFLFLWALLIVLVIAFLYIKAKDKMQEIAGDPIEIAQDSKESKGVKRKSLNKIKSTINTLDSAYSKTATSINRGEYSVSKDVSKIAKPVEQLNVVDLDALFKEHNTKRSIQLADTEEENQALEEFLSGFSFDDEEDYNSIEQEPLFNEELFNQIIASNEIAFSEDDITCINSLLSSEILDDTIRNIENYVVSTPVKSVTKDDVIQNLILEYTISQNISFSTEDVNALSKLVDVEMDKSLVSDLRTNPLRTREMEKEILQFGDKPKKPSEIVTLSVKDMLPDLSEALRLQGDKKIESNHKAETIYFSEGYEVTTLNLDGMMPDLSVEINNKDAYTSKPSADIEYVDTSYVVGAGELKISESLPDLKDALANPDKYSEPETEEVVVDADALLNNITNVQFKPFYDGTNEFEVLNDLSELPTMSDIETEFNQFEGFEISSDDDEPVENSESQDEYDDFESLYNNEYIDLDESIKVVEQNSDDIVQNNEKRQESAEDLIRKIEESKERREALRAKHSKRLEERRLQKTSKTVSTEDSSNESLRCVYQEQSYNVVSSVSFGDNKGCYLAKNRNGYSVIGYIDDRLIKIKQYSELRSEKIHARLSEKLPDGTVIYIVRIGIQKFIVNVKDDDIQYVMDLC